MSVGIGGCHRWGGRLRQEGVSSLAAGSRGRDLSKRPYGRRLARSIRLFIFICPDLARAAAVAVRSILLSGCARTPP
jgi:hypothetical protein